jgi:Nucleotidyl transferase AbiEii toxin, Type IV TA system
MLVPAFSTFNLVGGTALSLQLGHRISIDLDLFTTNPFDISEVVALLINSYNDVLIENETSSMVITNIDGIKVDFVKMWYPVLFPPLEIEGVRMLGIKDIAPMKLKAITQRGSKKDFYDIYYLFDLLTLREMLDLFNQKFKQQDLFHVVKSLTYFDDADKQPDPIVFDKSITWILVKEKVQKQVADLMA